MKAGEFSPSPLFISAQAAKLKDIDPWYAEECREMAMFIMPPESMQWTIGYRISLYLTKCAIAGMP